MLLDGVVRDDEGAIAAASFRLQDIALDLEVVVVRGQGCLLLLAARVNSGGRTRQGGKSEPL